MSMMRVATAAAAGGLDKLEIAERAVPEPGPGEILVRIHASSLNYHDYAVVTGMLPIPDGRIPMSDGAGEVVALGAGVDAFAVGDKVLSLFFPGWADGPLTPAKAGGVPGDNIDGFAAEYVAMPATAFTRMPAGYGMDEAATLPCAAVTAWRALTHTQPLKMGETVLVLGTGGVSIFALQFAKAAGARVIATSSSDAKLERLTALGADHVVNYKAEPRWGKAVQEITGGAGVDKVIEVGGPGTFGESIAACRMGGHIAMIGVLTGRTGEVPTAALFRKVLTVTGILVGSRQDQEDMVAAIEATGIRPVIDSRYPLQGIADAFAHQEAQGHFGKICLTV
ncbi:NAD(P)-dependent alcohol dehydrogenase [Marinibaculum pumilum]|uniref:NAD(P)-dependent alcohol dehydrogenase n=1 Tax=Marinibaculum pumilum TaxID=1766165 RepID=A0ABV7L1A2_9PROT